MKSFLIILSIFAMLANLVGCGGGGNENSNDNKALDSIKNNALLRGYYIDSPIYGIKYSCGKNSGTTNHKGEFNFKKGNSCKFFIGDFTYQLGL